jgi:hypothetical protein
VARGYRVEVFSYNDGLAVPDGIVRKDAHEILPADRVLRYQSGQERGSPSLHSNLFRYAMLHRLGGWWVDLDVVLLGSQVPLSPVFFAAESPQLATAIEGPHFGIRFGTAILKLPPRHPLLSEAVERCLAIGESATWSQTGPILFTELINKHQLDAYASDKTMAYPIPWSEVVVFFDPARCEEVRRRSKDSIFIHLWNEMWRRNGIPVAFGPPPGSFLDRLISEVDFDFKFRGRMEFVSPNVIAVRAKE